jgi:hypothetical protein
MVLVAAAEAEQIVVQTLVSAVQQILGGAMLLE